MNTARVVECHLQGCGTKDVLALLLVSLYSVSPCLSVSLANSDEASFRAVSCTMKRPPWWGIAGSLQPTVREELNPASNHMTELGSRPSPVELSDDCSPG